MALVRLLTASLAMSFGGWAVRAMHVPSNQPHIFSISGRRASCSRISQRVAPFVSGLHARARSAIREKRYTVASEIYNTIVHQLPEHVDVPEDLLEETYLLKALHDQRLERVQDARKTFSEGLRKTQRAPKLLTALALMESKNGNMRRAKRLVKYIADVDPQRGALLAKWKIFADDTR
mmetsp:Transcript_40933/g.65813  ORF Transcript_40933/g.65813 Transcript_40933/m.65813 type:complete len:178 (-) Transcript_40933:329-862(-)